MKGWIALDIDGTITLDKYSVPAAVIAYLKTLSSEGWRIALVTGRPYAFASRALTAFDFPFAFLVQNGSAALTMPETHLLFKHYIPANHLALLDRAFEGTGTDYLLYAGYEKGDFCYYRPDRFPQRDRSYLEELKSRQKEDWQPLKNFDPNQIGPIPLAKAFGSEEEMRAVAERLRSTGRFQVSQIRDHHMDDLHVLLITDVAATKGLALSALLKLQGKGRVVIAAGDDENDLSLFDAADIKIAMPHAPASLRLKADFIAPPVQEQGIIQALQTVLKHVS